MSSGTSRARANESELQSEQRRFDTARRQRELEREQLQAGLTAGAADAWAAAALARSRGKNLAAMGSPHDSVAFGRIDFDSSGETLYVGNRHIQASGVTVINWRAKMAEPYYTATIAQAMGLRLRRKFDTERNRIRAFQDEVFRDIERRVAALTEDTGASEPLTDDALLRSLEADRSAQMRDIAKTIQSAQYELVIAPADGTLIIQGGAGTGKTAVALHRVSMLLYRERDWLSPEDVLVIGPSGRFNQFIDTVLPSLGDAGVQHGDLLSLGPANSSGRADDDAVARIKGDARMATVIRNALYDRVRVSTDSSGRVTIGQGGAVARFTPEELETRLVDIRKGVSSYERGRRQFRQWLSTESSRRTRSRTGVDTRLLDGAVDRIWPRASAADVLGDLLATPRLLDRCSKDVLSPEEIGKLSQARRPSRHPRRWSKADVALLDELWSLIEGRQKAYKHVVVDEAQDLSGMQWRSVLRRCRGGSCTLVGDIAQSTGPYARATWADVAATFEALGPVRTSDLKYGYRVPRQVFDLAARLLPTAAPDVAVPKSVRSGPSDPGLHCVAADEVVDRVADQARALGETGDFSAVLADAETLLRLGAELRRRGIEFDEHATEAATTGLSLMTPIQAKGLEFDAVVVVEPARIARDDVAGARELYIALTRTTRHLHLVYSEGLPILGLAPWQPPTTSNSHGNTPVDVDTLLSVALEILAPLDADQKREFFDHLFAKLHVDFTGRTGQSSPDQTSTSPAQTEVSGSDVEPGRRSRWPRRIRP